MVRPRDPKVLVSDQNDTGLYELYVNAVKQFNQNMIDLAESYANNGVPDGGYKWTSRTGQEESKAVSYSYGGRKTVAVFKKFVSKHKPPAKGAINRNTTCTDADRVANPQTEKEKICYLNQYRGKVETALDADPDFIKSYGRVNQDGLAGNKYYHYTDSERFKWPGLIGGNNGEYDNDVKGPFYFDYWAGIDCEGLVLNALSYAEKPEAYAVAQMLTAKNAKAIPGVVLGQACIDDCSKKDANEICIERKACQADAWHSVTSSDVLGDVNVRKFFKWTEKGNIHYWRPSGKDEKNTTRLIKKGDVVHYNGHVSIVHSARWGDSINKTTFGTEYDIIHANGNEERQYVKGKKYLLEQCVLTALVMLLTVKLLGRLKGLGGLCYGNNKEYVSSKFSFYGNYFTLCMGEPY